MTVDKRGNGAGIGFAVDGPKPPRSAGPAESVPPVCADEILSWLTEAGQVTPGERVKIAPFGGGVSSDVFLISTNCRRFVFKRALERLRVEQDWRADLRRNASEQAYLEFADRVVPDRVPRVLHADRVHSYFLMTYAGDEAKPWKQFLFEGICDSKVACEAGDFLGRVHLASYQNAEVGGRFQTTSDFHALRSSPYFLGAARKHPGLKRMIEQEVERLESRREVLVHGDFSPKNILVRPQGIMVVDCEVAWYGDQAFDTAFLLTHFCLKALLFEHSREALGKLASEFLETYFSVFGHAELRTELESRIVRLLQLLLLARVDGKSPVEYLDDSQQNVVRRAVLPSLETMEAPEGFSTFWASWLTMLRAL